jgi:hypothetical protein
MLFALTFPHTQLRAGSSAAQSNKKPSQKQAAFESSPLNTPGRFHHWRLGSAPFAPLR